MKYRQNPEPTELRAQAERPAASRQEHPTAAQHGDISSLVHELQVYQTELEMQNEELRSARYDLEQSRAHYRTLLQRSVLASQVSEMAKTASLKQLASAVSHKFNAVLAAILGNFQRNKRAGAWGLPSSSVS